MQIWPNAYATQPNNVMLFRVDAANDAIEAANEDIALSHLIEEAFSLLAARRDLRNANHGSANDLELTVAAPHAT